MNSLQVKSQGGCLRACTIENEFICRSVLYRPSYKPGQPNCALYHLDHKTFPDGADTYSTPSPLPLLDSGETTAVYLETSCTSKTYCQLPHPFLTQSYNSNTIYSNELLLFSL